MSSNESCIRFENIGLLNSLVQQTLSIQRCNVGLNDANSCLLIHQLDFSKTVFVSITPGRNIVSRFFRHQTDHSGGTEGLRFLVIASEFEDRLARLKSSKVQAISFKSAKKGLQISGLEVAGTEQTIKHRLFARLYPGSDTDFGPIFRSDSLVADVQSSEFEFLIDLLLSFGGFSTEKQFESGIVTGAVHIEISENKLTAITANTNKCNQAHIEVSIPCNSHKDVSFCVEGFQLKALKNLAGTSQMIISDTKEPIEGCDWVSFEGQNGLVTLRKVVAKDMERLAPLDLFSPESEKAPSSSIRVCSLEEIASSVTIQQPSGVNNSLLLSEVKPHLQIQDAQDIGANEFSLVDINPDYVLGEWDALMVNKHALVLACDAIAKCRSFTEVLIDDVCLVQKAIQKKNNRKSPLLSMNLVFPLAEKTNVRFFCTANLPEENIDNLNTKD